MKRCKNIGTGVLIAAVVFFLALTAGCGGDSTSNSLASLVSISVGGVNPEEIPYHTTSAEWNDVDFYPYDMDSSVVYLNSLNVPLTVTVKASSGASIKLAVGTASDKPEPGDFMYNSGSSISLSFGDNLFIRIKSEDGGTTNYYRIIISLTSSNAAMSKVTVAGKESDLNGTAADKWDEVTVIGKVSLSDSDKTDAQVVVTSSTGATVRYAKAAGAAEPAFGANDTFTFADGDFLYIEITSENGLVTKYYKLEVQIGHDATLKSVTLGETEQVSDVYLGKPADSWDVPTADQGIFQTDPQPSTGPGLAVEIVPTDKDASVSWAVRDESTAPVAEPSFAAYTSGETHRFDGAKDYLYIKIESSNHENVNYYKMRIVVPMTGVIKYGTPELDDPDGMVLNYIDSLWNAEGFDFDVSRVNQAESIQPWFKQPWGQHTSAKAKALWDDDGVWVYADVDFINYKKTETGETLIRTAGIPATAVGPGSDDHLRDSLEVFVNERLAYMLTPAATGNNWGVQFRADPQTPPALSGDAGTGSPTGANAPITVYQNSGKTRAWLKPGNGGYIIVTQVPWIFGPTGAAGPAAIAQAGAIWNADGTIKDGAQIGFELQINACSVSGSRDGILTWNGVNTQAYQNARGYGQVTLELDGRSRVKNAKQPIISQQPEGGEYRIDEIDDIPDLTVTATADGTLSYQWYDADTDDPIVGAEDDTFAPEITMGGTYKYYVIVTNTIADNGDGGIKARDAKSNTVTIKVMSILPPQINSQPALSNSYTLDTPITLSVRAESLDSGNISYQWYEAASSGGTGTAISGATTATYHYSVTLPGTYYFYAEVTNTDPGDPGIKDTVKSAYSEAKVLAYNGALVEKLSLENGGYAVYRFDLPDGATWGDYNGLTVDYKVDAANIAKGIRGSRLMGVYKATDFTNGNASLNNFNAPYIIDGTNVTNWGTLGATADNWFTVTYNISGTTPPANESFVHLPAADEAGPFYFALGITGNPSSDANPGPITQLVKNITLVSSDGTMDVVSIGSGFAVSASVAYYGTEVVREVYLDEGDAVELVEELTLNQGAHAVFKFNLPGGATWADYTKVSVEFKFDAANLSKGFRNGGAYARLYGPLSPEMFTATNTAVKGTVRSANFNSPWGTGSDSNGQFIIAQTTLPGSNPGSAGFVADEWKTIEYLIDGTTANAAFTSAGNMPAAGATGPFYFGLGLASGDEAPIVQAIKNVTLVSSDGTKDVVSFGSGFTEPTFITYSPGSGAPGWQIWRELVTE